MRVVLFTDSDAFAGTERHMLDLASWLEKEGVEVQIACPVPSKLHARAQERGIGVVRIEKGGIVDVAAIRTLRHLLASGGVDVIHSHNGRTAFSASIAVYLAGRGHAVTTQHFLEPNRVSRKGVTAFASSLAHRWLAARTSRFVAISEAVRDCMIARNDALPERVRVVHNGISDPVTSVPRIANNVLRREYGLPDDTVTIFCAARLEPEKNVGCLIEAMTQLGVTHRSAHCFIAGEGSLEQSLRSQIQALGVGATVHLLGFRSDVLELMASGDVFVLPSLAEPFGLAILEAMAWSKAVIATDAGGPREIVVDGRTGFLVAPRSAEEIHRAIVRLIEEPKLAVKLGRNGRLRYEQQFTASHMAERMLAVYCEVAGASAAAVAKVGSPSADARAVAVN